MAENQDKSRKVSETIASAIAGAGAKVVTCVPGHGGSEVFDDFNKINPKPVPVSFHEEVAYSVAHGAALIGVRAASLLKSHGLLKAGNSVADSLYSGTTAGLVTVIFNDSNGQQSDSILDIGAFLKGIGLPFETAQKADIYRQIIHLFEQSEKSSLPYALVVESTDVLRSTAAGDWFKLIRRTRVP